MAPPNGLQKLQIAPRRNHIDGVLPEDHPEFYHVLNASTCYYSGENDPVKFAYDSRGSVYCEICAREERTALLERGVIRLTRGCHRLVYNARQFTHCAICTAQVLSKCRAVNCLECIEEFLRSRRKLRAEGKVEVRHP